MTTATCQRCKRRPVGTTPGAQVLQWCPDCIDQHQRVREQRKLAAQNRRRRRGFRG